MNVGIDVVGVGAGVPTKGGLIYEYTKIWLDIDICSKPDDDC